MWIQRSFNVLPTIQIPNGAFAEKLPAASVTTHVTVVVPTGNNEPGGTPVGTVDKPEQVSKAVGKTFNPNSTIKPIHYTVRNGDSLSRIASKYRVNVKDLHRWNKIKGKYIQPGQRLKLYIDVTEQSGA